MALSLANHVVSNGGRVLFLNPGKTELSNIIKAHNKYDLGEGNFFVFSGGDDVETIKNPRYENIFESIGYYYSTVQMLTYDTRYKDLPVDFFDLIIIDESHGFLGDVLSGPHNYFVASQIHMSATPYNMIRHVGNTVPHVYGEVSSQELIEEYDFPEWIIKTYEVEEKCDLSEIDLSEEEFNFEDVNNHKFLNTSKRFLIVEKILEDIILGGRTGLVYMPSVKDCEVFVKYVVSKNPILNGLVDFVSGNRTNSQNEKVEDNLRNLKIRVVLAKDIWNQSIDIPSITDIILNDPMRSIGRLVQRIGRGVRPCEEIGKTQVIIHDIVSSLYHTSQVGEPAIQAQQVVSKSFKESKKNYSYVKKTELSEEFLEKLSGLRDFGDIEINSKEYENISLIKQMYFFVDPNIAIDIFKGFAKKIFNISYYQLILNFDFYIKKESRLKIVFKGKIYEISLLEAKHIANFYNTFSYCKEYDFLSDFAEKIKAIEVDREINHSFLGFKFNIAINYVSTLNNFVSQVLKNNNSFSYQETNINMFSLELDIYGTIIVVKQEKNGDNTKMIRKTLAYKMLKKIEGIFSGYFSREENIIRFNSNGISEKNNKEKNPIMLLDSMLLKEKGIGKKIDWSFYEAKDIKSGNNRYLAEVTFNYLGEKYIFKGDKPEKSKKKAKEQVSKKVLCDLFNVNVVTDLSAKKGAKITTNVVNKNGVHSKVTILMLRNSIKKQNVFTDTFNRMKIKGLFTKPKYLIEEDIISCRFTHILSKNNHEATLELNKIKLGKDSKGKEELMEKVFDEIINYENVQVFLGNMLKLN